MLHRKVDHFGVRVAVVIFGLALLCSSRSSAQTSGSAQVVTSFTPEEIASIVRDAGYRAEIVHENDRYRVRTGMGGHNVTAYLYCGNDGKCASLDWDLAFNPSPKINLALANKWNRDKRYAKAYVGTDGSLFVEYSVAFAGGVTRETIAETARRFDEITANFDSWVDSASASP